MTDTRRTFRAAVGAAAAPPTFIEGLETRILLSKSVWTVSGDQAGRTADVIELRVHPSNNSRLQALLNGRIVDTRPRGSVSAIRVLAGGGDDEVSLDLGPRSDILTIVRGGGGDDELNGSAGVDKLRGGSGQDSLTGDLGKDRLSGGEDDDLLIGNEGNDRLHGDGGADTLAGGLDRDELVGGGGYDELSGGYGRDSVSGENGKDTLRGGVGVDSLAGGDGRDVLYRRRFDVVDADGQDVTRNEQQGNPLRKLTDSTEYKSWLIESAVERFEYLFDQPTNPWYRWGYKGSALTYDVSSPVAQGAEFTAGRPGSAPANPDGFSTTNTQEQGVDEADIVETDGQYIYLARGQEIIIIDAWPADEAKEVARISVEGQIDGIYLTGDKLTVVSEEWSRGDWKPIAVRPIAGGDVVAAPAFIRVGGPVYWSEPKVKVTVLDVSDRTAPTVSEETTLDGRLSASRMIDSRLYVVMDSTIEMLHPVTIEGEDGETVYESEASYRLRLEAMSLEEMLPGYVSSGGGQSSVSGSLAEDELYVPANERRLESLFSVVLFDVSDDSPEPDATTSVVGFSGTVYASKDNLYVTNQAYDAPMGDFEGDARTDIYKLSLGQGSVALKASGEVPGFIINSFAMGEQGNTLRIATTTNAGGQSNNLFVLDDAGDRFETLGSITGLAFSERIYSARFVGDRAYLVTFRQIDPLFTIDLSNPADPKVAGELKIPGYSSYLHPISGNRLIGFGRDADENGRVRGLQVSLFDVSDIKNPIRTDSYLIRDDDGDNDPNDWPAWNTSAAEWDHHAFAYFADRELLAVPVIDSGWQNGDARVEIVRIDGGMGLVKFGEVRHDSPALRSVRIGDYFYSISENDLKVVEFADTDTVLAHVEF